MDANFVNEQSILSIAGASAAVMYVTNVVIDMFKGWNAKYLAFFLCLVLSVLNVIQNANADYITWILSVVNACMLYCTSFGLNTSLAQTRGSSHGVVESIAGENSEENNRGLFPRAAAIFRAKKW